MSTCGSAVTIPGCERSASKRDIPRWIPLTGSPLQTARIRLRWNAERGDHRLTRVGLMLVAAPRYSPRHLLLRRSRLLACHGDEQCPWS